MNSVGDITSYVKGFIENFARNEAKKKLEDTIKFIDENNIIISYNENSTSPEVHLVKDGETIGYFSIVDLLPYETPSMSISIDEDESFRGKGLARLLIASMIYVIKNKNPYSTSLTLLFIDTDASNGFWEKIGMIENRFYLRKIYVIGRGYELVIDLKTLSQWVLNNNTIFGGGRTNTKSRTKKSQQKVAIKNRTKRLQQKVAIKNRKKSRNKKGNGQI